MREEKPLKIIPLVLSILGLATVLTFFFNTLSFPEEPQALEPIANLSSLESEGRFFTPVEPLPYICLVFWKKISFLSDRVSFISLSSFFYSALLHLFLVLLRKKEWKRNYFLLPALAAFIPYSFLFPYSHLSNIICLVFVLLLFLSFRMEKIRDLFIFPTLTILCFLSSLETFFIGFSFFVCFNSVRAGINQAQKTSVFFKKRNVPLLFFIAYFTIFCLALLFIHYFDFFGIDSLQILYQSTLQSLKHLGIPFLILGIGHILLRTEKELNTITASVLTVVLVGICMYFTYLGRSKPEFSPWIEEGSNLYNSLLKTPKNEIPRIIIPEELRIALQVRNQIFLPYVLDRNWSDSDLIYIQGLGKDSIERISKNFGSKKATLPGVLSLSEENTILPYRLIKSIEGDSSLEYESSLTRKSLGRWSFIPPEVRFQIWLQSLFGY